MKLSALVALPLVTAVSRTGIPSSRDLDLTSGFLQALLPRQDDPRVEYPELSTCFRLCFDNEISKIVRPPSTDLQKTRTDDFPSERRKFLLSLSSPHSAHTNHVAMQCAPTDLVCFCSQPALVGGLAQCLQTECKVCPLLPFPPLFSHDR